MPAGMGGVFANYSKTVGVDGPVAVPKILALPYGGRLKF